MRAAGSHIELEVDDAKAVYPLTVDPAFSQQAVLTPSDAATGNEFGYPIALSNDGNTALIGSRGNNAAYVFVRSSSRTWTEVQKLIPPVVVAFGISVALSGDGTTALVGGSGEQGGAADGFVYIFKRSGSMWTEQAQLGQSEVPNGFGANLSLSNDGNTALIGDSGLGLAYIFARTDSTWTRLQQLTPNASTGVNGYSSQVALSGDGSTALLSASSGENHVVNVFTKAGTLWAWQQELDVPALSLVYSVAVSSDGNTALIGTVNTIFAFSRTATTWTQQQELIDPDLNPTGNIYTFGLSAFYRQMAIPHW